MRTIHRFALPVSDAWQHLPQCVKILHVGRKEDSPEVQVWGLVDTNICKEPCQRANLHVKATGTGWEWPPDADYCGTVPMLSGLVWHVFSKYGP